jgi:hypothetical protein
MIADMLEPLDFDEFKVFLYHLGSADWNKPDGPIRLSSLLKLEDLAKADFFQNTRIFLQALDKSGGAPTTATGNLTRMYVAPFLDQLILSDPYRKSLRSVCKVINETDLWPLHLVRIVCECGKLVVRRNKKFQLTPLGRSLLPDDQAGALYRHLFIAYFRKFDLHYDYHIRDVPSIQPSMAIILWRLKCVTEKSHPVKGLAQQILLPAVHMELLQAMTSPYDKEESILCGYVLNPLSEFDLVCAQRNSDVFGIGDDDTIVLSPLWHQFISFFWKEIPI